MAFVYNYQYWFINCKNVSPDANINNKGNFVLEGEKH